MSIKQTTIRFPYDVYVRVLEMAERDRRNFNDQVVHLCERAVQVPSTGTRKGKVSAQEGEVGSFRRSPGSE